jgi:hypothetical protein
MGLPLMNMLGLSSCHWNSSFCSMNNYIQPLVWFELSLWKQSHIRMYVLRLFTALIEPFASDAMTSSGMWSLAAISLHCNDHYFVPFWYSFTELFHDLSHYSNLSLSDELTACTDRPVFWISCCVRCCWTGCCMLFPSVCGARGSCCWVSWRNAAEYDCSEPCCMLARSSVTSWRLPFPVSFPPPTWSRLTSPYTITW